MIFVLLVSLIATRGIADNNPKLQDQNEKYFQMFKSFFEKHAALSPDLTNIFPFGTPHFLDDIEQKHSTTIRSITYENCDLVVLEVLYLDWDGGAWVNTVFDLTGRCVKSLIREFMPAGEYFVPWDATDDCHVKINSGIYFCRIQVDQALSTYKVIVR